MRTYVLLFLLLAVLFGVPTVALSGVQDSARTVPAQVPGEVLRLDDLLGEVVARNPAVAAATYMVEAQKHRVPQAGALPDPTVSIGWMGNPTPFSVQEMDPSSYRGVQAMQMIPLGGKLSARKNVARKEVGVAQTEVEGARRRLTAEMKAAFYEYFAATKQLESAQRNRELLKKLAEIADARYRVGKGMQQDLLKSQVEISMLLQRVAMIEQQKAIAQARINTLLSRPADAPLPPPEDINFAPVNVTLDQITAQARNNDPELKKMGKMVERNEAMVAMTRKEYVPDLNVGYMYQQRPMMPDMHGFTFGVNIPIFYGKKRREAVKQAQAETRSAEANRSNRENELMFEVRQQYLAAKASEQLLNLFSKAIAPQSSLALESSMASYQVGNVDFLSVLSNFTPILNSEIEYYRELANYRTALARIEALTGVDPTSSVGKEQ